jgi:hypothetical protein
MSRYQLSITIDTDAPLNPEANRVLVLSHALAATPLFLLEKGHRLRVREVGLFKQESVKLVES